MSWKIRHIFDGEYGCEELKPGEKPKVSVTLVNENREEWIVSVEDEWLIGHGLEEGDVWPEFWSDIFQTSKSETVMSAEP